MRGKVRLAVLLIVLITAVDALPGRAVPAEAATGAGGATVYQAGWSRGLTGWSIVGGPDWGTSAGVASYNGKADGEILAPYRARLHDFAVEARIQRIGPAGRSNVYGDRGYGVVVWSSGRTGSGVRGGFYAGEGFVSPQSGIYWAGNRLPGEDVALHDGYNTFRLTVHGNRFTVSEDGVTTVRSAVYCCGSGSRFGIFSVKYRIRVKSFKVIALPPSRPVPAPRTSVILRLETLGLRRSDVPANFRRYRGDYHTNLEIARDRGETTADVAKQGRILSLNVGYIQPQKKGGPRILEATVVAFRTVSDARTAFTSSVLGDRSLATSAGYHESIPGKFGVDDFLAIYPSSYRLTQYTFYDLLFQRGDYYVDVALYFPVGTVSPFDADSAITAAGHGIDGRLQRP